jgi:hypothetical protein
VSLADKAKTRTLAPKRNPIDAWLETLEHDEREAAMYMLTTPREWPQLALVDAFAEEGYAVGKENIGRWRRANNVARV